MTALMLAEFVGDSTGTDFVQRCWDEAGELVDAYIGEHEVPEDIHRRARLNVGSELYHQRNAPGGITQFASLDGQAPPRLARDPMLGAYPMLDRFLPGGFA